MEPYATELAVTDLVAALASLETARRAIDAALSIVQGQIPPRRLNESPVVRTTAAQVLAVLAAASHPLTLQDIADGVVAIRRDEDEPRKGGGTRYQELTRTSLARLIKQGLVERIEPTSKSERMSFRRI